MVRNDKCIIRLETYVVYKNIPARKGGKRNCWVIAFNIS